MNLYGSLFTGFIWVFSDLPFIGVDFLDLLICPISLGYDIIGYTILQYMLLDSICVWCGVRALIPISRTVYPASTQDSELF